MTDYIQTLVNICLTMGTVVVLAFGVSILIFLYIATWTMIEDSKE